MNSSTEFSVAFALLRFLGFLVAITMYQAGIAIMAKYRGDHSLQTRERATLNPLPHIELMGTIIFPLITILVHSPVVFGWPKPFMIDPRAFKNPKKDTNFVYLAGIGINFIIAVLCMIILRYLGGGFLMPSPQIDFSASPVLIRLMLGIIGLTNMIIGSLYLLPFPGTAGWNILLNNVSYQTARKLQDKAMIISIVSLLFIVSGLFNFYFNIFVSIFALGSLTIVGF